MAKTIGSIPIRYRSDTFASDRYQTDIDPRAFAIWDIAPYVDCPPRHISNFAKNFISSELHS